MKKIYINNTSFAHGCTIHSVIVPQTLEKTIGVVLSEKVINNLYHIIKQDPSKSFHFYTLFCQFIFSFEYTDEMGITLKFLEFGNIDEALDYYLKMKMEGANIEDINKVSELAQKIFQQTPEHCEIVMDIEVLP